MQPGEIMFSEAVKRAQHARGSRNGYARVEEKGAFKAEIDADLAAPGAPAGIMILQVHDELLFETPPEAADALAALVRGRMEQVPELSVPIEVHLGRGRTWLEAH